MHTFVTDDEIIGSCPRVWCTSTIAVGLVSA
jgi:hypothetical protein